MPEPGSKAYDKKRQEYRPSGPRTERGRGPEGERESGGAREEEHQGPTG